VTVTQALSILETGGLIHLAAVHPELEYAFRHVLIQDAAYLTLVKANRRVLHKAVGESLEQLYPDRLVSPELAPVLARHFAEGGDPARALNYYLVAGRAAADRYANAEAIHYFSLALEIATTLAAGGDAAADLFLRRGRALELNAQDAEAVKNYQEMEAWAEARGNRPDHLAAMTARATIHVKPSVQQNLDLGYDLSQKALALARELGDRTAEAKVLWNLLQHQIASGSLDHALEYADQALRIARAEGLREQIAQVLTDVWKVHLVLGQPEQALAAVDEAQAIWRELGVLNMLSDNLATTAMLNALAGHYPQALALSDEARQVSREIGNKWNESYSLFMLDLVHFERGDIGRAIAVADDCVRLAEQAGFAEGLHGTSVDLALIYAYMGAWPRAFGAAHDLQARVPAGAIDVASPLQAETLMAYLQSLSGQQAEARAALDRSPFAHNPALLNDQFILLHQLFAQAQAELALANGEPQQALRLAEDLIAHFRRAGVRLYFTDALLLRGQALAGDGRVSEAQAALEAAREEAEQLGSRRTLWLILSELAALASRSGDHEAAKALWRQAAEIIDYIAAHAGSVELRQSFLNRPDVRQTLAQAAQRRIA
jgi:tetratricopeptide (TPR) repeat protein